jgi:integrase
MVMNTLREWKLQGAKGTGDLVFPAASGDVQDHKTLVRALDRVLIEAELIDNTGAPKYHLHSLRHFYASWCINRKSDGGLELPAKVVQGRLGHSSIVMTMDRYGHLFPSTDDGSELAEAEKLFLA